MARQAKCCGCKIVYRWDRDYPLKRAVCPQCRRPLERTSYQKKGWPTSRVTPDVVKIR